MTATFAGAALATALNTPYDSLIATAVADRKRVKRDLHICQKKLINIHTITIYDDRQFCGRGTCNSTGHLQRPICMSKETYIHVKRDLYTC